MERVPWHSEGCETPPVPAGPRDLEPNSSELAARTFLEDAQARERPVHKEFLVKPQEYRLPCVPRYSEEGNVFTFLLLMLDLHGLVERQTRTVDRGLPLPVVVRQDRRRSRGSDGETPQNQACKLGHFSLLVCEVGGVIPGTVELVDCDRRCQEREDDECNNQGGYEPTHVAFLHVCVRSERKRSNALHFLTTDTIEKSVIYLLLYP